MSGEAKTSSQPAPKLPPETIVPHDNDVLCGRGGSINTHPGNETFRRYVDRRKRVYLTARFKREKRLIASSIVKEIRSLDPPGRFLAKDSKSNAWYDIGDEKARDKTSQALRENAPSIRKEIDKENDVRREQMRREEEEAVRRAAEAHRHYHGGPGHWGGPGPHHPPPHGPPGPGGYHHPPPPHHSGYGDYYHDGRYPHPPPPYYEGGPGPDPRDPRAYEPPPPPHGAPPYPDHHHSHSHHRPSYHEHPPHGGPPPPYHDSHPPSPLPHPGAGRHCGSSPSPGPGPHGGRPRTPTKMHEGRPRTPPARMPDGRPRTPPARMHDGPPRMPTRMREGRARTPVRTRTPEHLHGPPCQDHLSGPPQERKSAFEIPKFEIPKSFAEAQKSFAETSTSFAETIKSNIPTTFSFGTAPSVAGSSIGGEREGDRDRPSQPPAEPSSIRKPSPHYPPVQQCHSRDSGEDNRSRMVHFQSPEHEDNSDQEVRRYYDEAEASRRGRYTGRYYEGRLQGQPAPGQVRPSYSPLPVPSRHPHSSGDADMEDASSPAPWGHHPSHHPGHHPSHHPSHHPDNEAPPYHHPQYGVPPSPSSRTEDSGVVFHRLSSNQPKRRYGDSRRAASPYSTRTASPIPASAAAPYYRKDGRRSTSPYPYNAVPPVEEESGREEGSGDPGMGGQGQGSSTTNLMSQFAQHILSSWDSHSLTTKNSREETLPQPQPLQQQGVNSSASAQQDVEDSKPSADGDPDEIGQEVLLEMDSMDLEEEPNDDEDMPPPQPVPVAAASSGQQGNMFTAPTPPVANRDSEVRTPPPGEGGPQQGERQTAGPRIEIDWPSRVGGLSCHSWIRDSIKETCRETRATLFDRSQGGDSTNSIVSGGCMSRANSLTISPQLSMEMDGVSLCGTEMHSCAGSVGGASLCQVFEGETAIGSAGPVPALNDMTSVHSGSRRAASPSSSSTLRATTHANSGRRRRSAGTASPFQIDSDQSLLSKNSDDKSLNSIQSKGSQVRARFAGPPAGVDPSLSMTYSLESATVGTLAAGTTGTGGTTGSGGNRTAPPPPPAENFVWSWDGKSKTGTE